MIPYSASKFALEAIADGYRFELTPFGIESILVEPGIYRTAIFDRLVAPADAQRVADYGAQGDFADRVLGTYVAALNEPGAPGSEEVAETFVRLVEMDAGTRPFRTVVPAATEQLLGPYNAAAEALRPITAQIFNVPDLVRASKSAGTPSG
jgi:NAD(P)-dependent dehydrogenase (short-subunit alcohol dehydrogenase family)